MESVEIRRSEPLDRRIGGAKRNYVLGIALLLIVVLLWTSSNFILHALFEGGFQKPFLVTYLSTCSFTFYLVPYVLGLRLDEIHRTRDIDQHQYRAVSASEGESEEGSYLDIPPKPEDLPLTTRETARLALIFSFLWFIANWSVNASLGYTSVASCTILTTTSGFFTLGVGSLFKVERFTLIKCGAVVSSFVGVVLVSLSDSQQDPKLASLSRPGALFGDFLALLSALFYAIYVVFLKVGIGSESRVNMKLFFGFIGLFTLLFYWPFGLLLDFTGMESLSFPHGRREWLSVLVNSLITFASDYLFLLAMLKTTPLVVTIGLSMTIPIALIGDQLLGRPTALWALLGGILILLGFVVVGVADANQSKSQDPEGTQVQPGE